MTLVIAVSVVLVVGSVVYSAYRDYSAVKQEFQPGSSQVQANATQYGSSGEKVSIAVIVPNGGLYTLNVALTCDNTNTNIICSAGTVSVPPGQQQTLHFALTIVNVQQYLSSSDRRINGTVAMGLEPFVNLSIEADLSGLVPKGGA